MAQISNSPGDSPAVSHKKNFFLKKIAKKAGYNLTFRFYSNKIGTGGNNE